MRVIVTLACVDCKQRNYTTNKNKRNNPDRIEMKKFCKFCNEQKVHRETR
jgi:large subunit ribosomal protein L33